MRIHGRSGVAYLGLNSGDAASPVAFLSDWAITVTRQVLDTTGITDSQIVYTTETTDISGSFSGFYDTASSQSYAAAVDGLPRNLYLYPSIANTGTFFAGMVLPDYSIKSSSGAACALTVNWAAEAAVTQTRGSSGSPAGYSSTYQAVYENPAGPATYVGRYLAIY